MLDRFVVEADKKAVGVAVRIGGGFQFFSSDPAFDPIDGRVFPRARALAHHIAQLTRALRTARRPTSGKGAPH